MSGATVEAASPARNLAGLTRALTEKIVALRFETLPRAVVEAASTLVLDGIAVAVAGARLETAPGILAEYLREQGGAETSSLLGLGFGLPPASAALVNGASMHVLDFEPMWKPATHALSPVLAAVLALAEARQSNGKDIVTALVKGIEIQGWLRQAGNSASRDLRFHPPGVVGPIGAVIACSSLLGFNAEQLANAIGVVSSRCGGLFSNLGTMTKSSHCGYAASSGLEAALLTERGFTGSGAVFDASSQGYMQGFMPADADPEMLLRFGETFRILDPGFAIKIFPAKFSTHYGITAGLELHPQVRSPEDIERVEIIAADVPSSDRPFPKTGLEGKFSVQYTAAAALLDGQVGLQTFTDERLARADMQSLLAKTRFVRAKDMSSQYDSDRHAEIVVHMRDGSALQARCSHPRGSWGGAPILAAERDAKVRSCLAVYLPETSIERIVKIGSHIETCSPGNIAELLRLASGRDLVGGRTGQIHGTVADLTPSS